MHTVRHPAARIVAVDDEPANVAILARILARAGYTDVTTTTDPRDVVEVFRAAPPDLLLMDLHMPEMDGLALLDAVGPVLAAEEYLPVLVLSGDLSPEARQQALARGARDFVGKPFEGMEVLLRIGNLLHARFLHLEVTARNRALEATVAARTRELEDAHHDVLERLAQAAEFRDDETGQHTRRVGALAARLALRMGVAPERAERIRRAAALHDVGKIGIPDAILRKRGPLTPAERAEMQRHTTIGAAILANGRSPTMAMAEQVALCHHERWDGHGYPRGLAGEAIPLEARIVAAADFADALSHDRPYRPAWRAADVRAEVRRQAGRHLDPSVALALLALLEEDAREGAALSPSPVPRPPARAA